MSLEPNPVLWAIFSALMRFVPYIGAYVTGSSTPIQVVAGSMIGGIQETQEMLDFCAEHGIGATIEVITADEVTEAYDKVVAGDVRYRYVIDTSTIGS